MKTVLLFIAFVLSLLVIGCGGGGTTYYGQVSGIVTDVDGNVVRGARVWVDGTGHQTVTNSAGLYLLEVVPEEDVLIRASVTRNGITYVGSNVARVYADERAKSTNIVVVRDSQTATVKARVLDNQGYPLEGARVFALIQTGGVYSSSMALTDRNGNATIRHLMAGQDYVLLASGRGYQSDTDNVNLYAGETYDIVFTLGNPTNVNLPAPTNLEASAWTSPNEISRSPKAQQAIEAFKTMVDPRRAKSQARTRDSYYGNWIEVDLYWTPVSSNNLLGYGIYRAQGATATTSAIDYLRDPLAEYYSDLDSKLIDLQTYSYQVTALNTLYGYTGYSGTESAKSERAVVDTLSDLDLMPVTQSPLTFNWYDGSGADSYKVYLFSQYPSFGIDWIWSSSDVTGTSAAYSGPALISGKRYYYIVLGTKSAKGSISRTVSNVGEFVKN